MIYTTEVQHMCPVAKGAYHGPAPIPEEGKWVQAKEISDISGFTHGVGWCAPQQGACKLTLNVKNGVIAWLIGGAIMLACILTFAGMSQKYEKVNGIVDYAEATVGPKYGYYMGWFLSTIYYPSLTAALAWLSARYTLVFLTTMFPNMPLLIHINEGGVVVGPECIALMLFYLCCSYAVNALSPKLAGKIQASTTVIKLIPLGVMAIVGIIAGLASGQLTENFVAPPLAVVGSKGSILFAAVCATSFAYEGWIIATTINSELKDSKRNLPKALTVGGIIVIATYLLYYIGVTGGASNAELIEKGATVAFTNIFGNVIGNILNLFIAISCIGTMNGLMLACCRGVYSVAARGKGPATHMFSRVDEHTNMPNNSAVMGLLLCGFWGLYFYLSNLAGTWSHKTVFTGTIFESVPFLFDPTELPIITIYALYIPVFIQWIRKQKGTSVWQHYILPILAICGSVFMVIACLVSHGMGCFWYLIVFAFVMVLGGLLNRRTQRTVRAAGV